MLVLNYSISSKMDLVKPYTLNPEPLTLNPRTIKSGTAKKVTSPSITQPAQTKYPRIRKLRYVLTFANFANRAGLP